MTLNRVMAVTLHYFNEFGKPAFQFRTICSSIEHFDQKLRGGAEGQRTMFILGSLESA